MNQSDRAKLRKLAEAATPGVWTCDQPHSHDDAYPADECPCRWDESGEYEYVGELADGGHVHLHHEIHQIRAGGEYVATNYDYEDAGIVTRADRDYIIAAQPARVLALLDELDAAEQARRKAVDAHGQASVALAAVQATVARVRSLHCPMDEPDSGGATYCWHCNMRWPCDTTRALHGAADLGDVTGTPGLVWEVKGGDAATIPDPDADLIEALREASWRIEHKGGRPDPLPGLPEARDLLNKLRELGWTVIRAEEAVIGDE